MMTRDEKGKEVSAISERFGRAKAAFLVDFKGMDVESVTRLRKALVPLSSEMRVVRNTLAKRALAEHPQMGPLKEHFLGTNAIVFAYEDPTAIAKSLTQFAGEMEALQVKTGVMDGEALDEAKIKFLATLPSKVELQAQLLGVLQAPMSKMLGTLQAASAGFVRVLSAYKDKQSS